MEFSETYEFIALADFDTLARKKKFAEGPFVSTFGDGYGEPYTPERPVWGKLKDGRTVRSVKKVESK